MNFRLYLFSNPKISFRSRSRYFFALLSYQAVILSVFIICYCTTTFDSLIASFVSSSFSFVSFSSPSYPSNGSTVCVPASLAFPSIIYVATIKFKSESTSSSSSLTTSNKAYVKFVWLLGAYTVWKSFDIFKASAIQQTSPCKYISTLIFNQFSD